MPAAQLSIGLLTVIMFVKQKNWIHRKYSPNQIKRIISKHWLKRLLNRSQPNLCQRWHPNWFQIGAHSIKPICHLFAIINHKLRPIPTKLTVILPRTSPFTVIASFEKPFYFFASFPSHFVIDQIKKLIILLMTFWLFQLQTPFLI